MFASELEGERDKNDDAQRILETGTLFCDIEVILLEGRCHYRFVTLNPGAGEKTMCQCMLISGKKSTPQSRRLATE